MFLYQHALHEEQTRGARSFGPIPELQHHWHKWNLVCPETGVPCWMLTGSSGGIGRAEEVEGVLDVMERLKSMEFAVDNGTVESLWVRIKGQVNNVDVIVGVCYRPPNLTRMMMSRYYSSRSLDTSKLTALVLMTSTDRMLTGNMTQLTQAGPEDS